MPTTTPSDEKKALYLLSGVVTVDGVEWVAKATGELRAVRDCHHCAHHDINVSPQKEPCKKFTKVLYEGYGILNCPHGFAWIRLKPE